MSKRRDFLKKAGIGAVAAGMSGWNGVVGAVETPERADKAGTAGTAGTLSTPMDTALQDASQRMAAGWTFTFDERDALLSMQNGPASLSGNLTFVSGTNTWKVACSRDGVSDRHTLVDSRNNVQGYLVFLPDGNGIQLLFYHRTAQAYKGVWSFEGEIHFTDDSFACRTRPVKGERVLSLRCGAADSLWNDSLFAPASDCALQIDATRLNIRTLSGGRYAFLASGTIEESSEAAFTIRLETQYFKRRFVPYYRAIDRQRCPKAPTGWMSWNTYFDKATAEDNLKEARIGQKYLQPFGCEFWSIESWQGNSDQLPVRDFFNMNLETNKKQFPKGMKKLADDIRKLGFRPGIWIPPFGTGSDIFYREHKEWFLHDKNGQPISSWNGRYMLDPTVPEAVEHLKNMFRTASREWGYEFFKIDGISGNTAYLYERSEVKARFKDPACPNPIDLCLHAFRESIGDDRVFLACLGHISGPEASYADATRIGADIVHPNTPVKWRGVMDQGRCFMNQAFAHNIALIADPDTLLVRDLPLAEARTSATIVALPGQLTFFGDMLEGLSSERMKILQQTLPVADVYPESLYPYFSMLPVWNLHVRHALLGNYNVVALFNWEDERQTIRVTAAELGIDEQTARCGYEFWTEQAVPFEGALSMEVPAHDVRLIALHPVASVPQWLSSDRHIAQHADELSEYVWDADHRSLKGKIRIVGGFPLTARFQVPSGYACSEASCDGATHTLQQGNDGILSVTFNAKQTTTATFQIKF